MLSDTLQIKIRDANKTNIEFARGAGIKKRTLDAILKGEKPDNWTIQKLAKALEIEDEEIKSWTPQKVKTIPLPSHKIIKTDFKKKQKSPIRAKGRFCIRCFFKEQIYVYNTVELAHYTGIRQHIYGKCRGEKVSDILKCPLCKKCHNYFDIEIDYKSVEKSEEFLFYIALFVSEEFEIGNIVIKKAEL